eukprot:6952749-Pyramimonas_sp.AAC.1
MKHFAMMSDASLSLLCDILGLMGRSAVIPMQISIITMALIAKPSSGFRPIGIFCSAFRLYGKLRRTLADKWEARFT